MKKRTPLALLTATSALLIPIVPAQAVEQPKETVELHGAVGDAVNAGAAALGVPGAGQMDIGRIAEGLIGVIDRAGGGGKIIDLTSGDTISIDPAVLRTLEGVAPPLKALRGLTNTSGPALDLLKQIIADGDKLDLPKLSDLLDKADAPSSSRSGLLDRLGSSNRSSSKPELSSRLGSLLDRNRDKETTTTPTTTTSARNKQDGFKPDSVNGETTNHSLLDRLRGLGGKNGEEDTTIDAGKLDKGDYRIRGTYVDQNGEKRPVDLKLTVGGDDNESWENSMDGKDKEDKDKNGKDKEDNAETGESSSDSDSSSGSGSNSDSGSGSGSNSGDSSEPTDEVDTHAQKPEKRVMPISDNTDGSSSASNSDSGQQGQTTPTTANNSNGSTGTTNGGSTINQNRTVGNTQRGNSTAAQNTTPAPAPNNTTNTNAADQNNPESLPTTGAGLRWVGLVAVVLAVAGATVLLANRKKTAK